MLNTCENALAKSDTASVLVFFTHHRPHLADRDMEFFAKARQRGWLCEEIVSRKYPVSRIEEGLMSARAHTMLAHVP